MKISEIMTSSVEIISADASVEQAAEKMRSLDVGMLPVYEGDRMIGTITDRDITIRVTAEGLDPTTTSVSEAMTEGVVHCREDESIERAAELMEERQIRRLVVVDEDNRPVGIVSLGDLAVRVHDDRLTGEVTERVSEPAKIRR